MLNFRFGAFILFSWGTITFEPSMLFFSWPWLSYWGSQRLRYGVSNAPRRCYLGQGEIHMEPNPLVIYPPGKKLKIAIENPEVFLFKYHQKWVYSFFPFDYLSLFRRKHRSTSISIRFHQCERWRKWKGKCFAESFAERLKLSLKPSTVLSTATGELPEFHGNQTSAVSFWFRTSEKHLQKAPPQKYIPKTTRIHPPKKQLCQNYTKNK